MSATVEIFTRPGCGYCSATKSLLARKSATFTEYDVATNSKFRDEMVTRSNGGTTFPQIFIDKVHVGGCDELYALDREGKLDNLLARQNADSQKVSP